MLWLHLLRLNRWKMSNSWIVAYNYIVNLFRNSFWSQSKFNFLSGLSYFTFWGLIESYMKWSFYVTLFCSTSWAFCRKFESISPGFARLKGSTLPLSFILYLFERDSFVWLDAQITYPTTVGAVTTPYIELMLTILLDLGFRQYS